MREQLGYIKALGAGAIWLTPVLKNIPYEETVYHGYGIQDFLSRLTRVSPRTQPPPGQIPNSRRRSFAVWLTKRTPTVFMLSSTWFLITRATSLATISVQGEIMKRWLIFASSHTTFAGTTNVAVLA